jgi:hypothetical protein
MNVDPVHARSAGIERQTPEKILHVVPPRSLDPASSPTTGTVPTQSNLVPLLIPEHEVKVQWDPEADQVMIYRILDKQSGNLVLQVPSAEILNSIHQTQELLQRIAARGKVLPSNAASTPVVKEDKKNGNQL